MGNKIYKEPINEIIGKLNEEQFSNVLLMGGEGVGKSIVLSEYTDQSNWDHIIVNGSVKPEEMFLIADPEINNLYHVCLVVSKMIDKINLHYKEVSDAFFGLETKINSILRNIYNMKRFSNYTNKYNNIGVEICTAPEVLLDEFLKIALKYVEISNITVILDDFDTIGLGNVPSIHYQQYMYNLLKDYVRLVVTVSDTNILNNESEKERLSEFNSLISVEYGKEVEVVKEIIDKQMSLGKYKNEKVGLLLSDETIYIMIEKTNGNLFDILRAIKEFYRKINSLDEHEYDVFILNYIDKVINKNPIITGIIKRERKFII